jgi:hypothetical protein
MEYTNGCFSPMAHIFTTGSQTVSSDEITVCWVVNNGTPDCALFDSNNPFQIGWGMNLQPTYWDTICINPCESIELMCYVSHANDPDHSNDTLRVILQDDCTLLKVPELQNTQIQIFPNPANSQINVRLNDQAEVLNVLTIDGKIKLSIQNPTDSEYIDLTAYHSGIYFIQVISDNHKYFSRFIKE